MRPLTDSERQLVVENKGLVYEVVYRMVRAGKLLPRLVEDAISEGMIGLMKAAVFYDPSIGHQFSTLAMLCIQRKIIDYIKKEINQTKLNVTSLDEPNAGREGETLGELLPARDDVESDAVDWLSDAVELISHNHPKALHLETLMEYVNGRNLREIAEERGVSKQRIQFIISEAKRILRNRLDPNDWS